MATTISNLDPEFVSVDQYEVGEQISPWMDTWRRLRRNRLAVAGLAFVGLLLVVAIIQIFYTPYPIYQQSLTTTYAGPSLRLQVGVGTALLSSVIGIALGLLAGFYRGWVDSVISLFINVAYGIPDLLVAMIFVVVTGNRGLQNIILAISLTSWLGMARLVRGQTLSLREREFVEAARSIGTRDLQILLKHIFPNALGPIIVQATFLIPAAIIFEAFLSFLGLGVAPPSPSWGAMASDGFRSIQIAPHIILVPALAISLTVMAFNFLGDGLRDALDPRMRR